MSGPIPFIDLASQQARIKGAIDAGIAGVLEHGRYVFGPEIDAFEAAMATFGEAEHVVACANGTDAILLNLMAWGVGPDDAVFCPSFTYCATAEVVGLARATPIFIDIDRDTYNMDPTSLRAAIEAVIAQGELTPRAVISVDLFGQSADYPAIKAVCDAFGLKLIADSAQGFGTTLNGKHPLHWADVSTTSFFPAKPLGCYGDGGAVLTDDGEQNRVLRSLRMHGSGRDRYDNVRIGLNSRLDSIQAAVLLPKLEIYPDEIEARNRVAARYSDALASNAVRVPSVMDGVISTWAQYTIEVAEPDALQAALQARGVPSARYYPRPVHQQTAYAGFPVGAGGLRNTEAAAARVISLPMHAYLTPADQDRVIEAVLELA